MSATVVTINAGSSSIKFAAFETASAGPPERLLHGEIDNRAAGRQLLAWDAAGAPLPSGPALKAAAAPADDRATFRHLFEWLEQQLPGHRVQTVAHRVVHGGAQFIAPVRLTPEVLVALDALTPLAPLHQPHNLAAVRAIAALEPGLLQVACFDTAFHAGQPWVMQALALPRRITDAGVKRYGFHGLSYEYIASVLPAHLGVQAAGRVVVAHLGNGASLCAMRERRSLASTMGFTALDGLMMGTRCGTLGPGVVLYLIQSLGLSASEVESMLYKESGLLGVSGLSSDMRSLQDSPDPRAAQAIDLFVNRIAGELGGLAAMLGGLDALVFTAGIGEHSAPVRRRVCEDAAWLGLDFDAAANADAGGPVRAAGAARISRPGSRVAAWVIPTDEESMLAEHARALLAAATPKRTQR